MNHIAASTFVLRLALLSVGLAVSLLAQAAESDRLRVVRVGKLMSGNEIRADVAWQEAGCRLAKNMPEAAPTPLPDSLLRSLRLFEEEELFDGDQWASYRTTRLIGPDFTGDCRVGVYATRRVSVRRACGQWTAGGIARSDGAPFGRVDHPPKVFPTRSKAGSTCKAPTVKPLSSSATLTPAGQGARCVWMVQEVVAPAFNATTPTTTDDTGFDVCVLVRPDGEVARLPASEKAIVLMTRSSPKGKVLAYMSEPGNQVLEEFQPGAAIDSARFTEAGINAFIRRPIKEPLKETP